MEYLNSKTGDTVHRSAVQDKEVFYTGKTMILETDREGYVTYTNRRFLEASGYAKEELIGLPHCIHMHPDMPEDIFKDACQMTSSGKTWSGYVRNISKDGISYWTEIVIQPKFDNDKNIIGYMATRKKPDKSELLNVIVEYKKLKELNNTGEKSQYCGEVYLGRGSCGF